MKLRTFEAESMAAALVLVKRELGDHAVIVQTRTLAPGGLLRKPRFEITAVESEAISGQGSAISNQRSAVSIPPMSNRKSEIANQQCAIPAGAGRLHPQIAISQSRLGDPNPPDPSADSLRHELTLIRRMVQDVLAESRRGRLPDAADELVRMYSTLIQNDVADELARRLLDDVRGDPRVIALEGAINPAAIKTALADRVADLLPPVAPLTLDIVGRPKRVALVGPTGVGKTTTIAKLAAHFKLRERKKVALVTADTYRIAAVEQLKVYANILDLPLSVVMSPAEMPAVLDRHRDCDLILMDTAGRSQRNRDRLAELKQYLDAARPDEVHLVLASTASQATLTQAIEQFAAVGPSSLILTKLDEAAGMGLLLNVLARVKLRVSYLTNGQSVPNDIEAAARPRLAQWILDGCVIAPNHLTTHAEPESHRVSRSA